MKTLKTLCGIWWRRGRVVLGAVLLTHSCTTPFVLLIIPFAMLLGIWFPNLKVGAPVDGEVALLVITTLVSLMGGTFHVLDQQRYRVGGHGEITLEDTLDRLFREQIDYIKKYNTLSLMMSLVRWLILRSNHRHLSFM